MYILRAVICYDCGSKTKYGCGSVVNSTLVFCTNMCMLIIHLVVIYSREAEDAGVVHILYSPRKAFRWELVMAAKTGCGSFACV